MRRIPFFLLALTKLPEAMLNGLAEIPVQIIVFGWEWKGVGKDLIDQTR